MTSNTQTNNFLKWMVAFADFAVLNALLLAFILWHPVVSRWSVTEVHVFWLASNMSMLLAQFLYYNVVHRRFVTAGDILKRVLQLTLFQVMLTYVLLKVLDVYMPSGRVLAQFLPPFFLLLLLSRFVERSAIKRFRQMGRNTRTVTFVGLDPSLQSVYECLSADETLGYRILGVYADGEKEDDGVLSGVPVLGTLEMLLRQMKEAPDQVELGDEVYVCLSRRERDTIRLISHFCDRRVVRFYFVPVSVESLGINLKRELLDDIEIYTTYENPLQNPANRLVKRLFDIVLSGLFLLGTAVLFPFIRLIVWRQSPGPVFFKQLRTGLDGKSFYCYKFRSMHVNKDADRVQATKDDPRKFPFGNFMRKANLDELPQFWNVLKGDMSIVGPRPHMLAHTEMYSQLIDKYMVRHFVKPGVTGWAQVTGFRGETKELWQMEGRVKRDIWYIEHWSFWLDIRIIWMTAKSIVVHDQHAY